MELRFSLLFSFYLRVDISRLPGPFHGCSWMGGIGSIPFSKSVTHIPQ